MYQVYEIMDNDTIDLLALKFGTTTDELERINSNFNFKTGNLMVVPSDNSLYYKYTVRDGDTLYGISKMYNQDVDTLYMINGIKEGDYIYPGEEILILKNNIRAYVTKDNDTLESISNKMTISSSEIIKNNKSIYLLPGQLVVYKES